MGLFARLGLAITSPRWALATASDRAHAGRSGTDLIAVIALVLLATRLRGLATAVWLGGSVSTGMGIRAGVQVLTGMLAVPLMLLLIGALLVFALAGRRRNLGRAFDLICVAALPILFIDLIATVAVRALHLHEVPDALGWLLSGVAYGWMGCLVALAVRPARTQATRVPEPPDHIARRARRSGWVVAAVIALGIAVQALWMADHVDEVRPMTTGDAAPALALPAIDATGQLGERVALESARGKVVVLDFWATWCKPCLVAMPKLEQLARAHPDLVVLAINTDDPVAARALFNQRGYTMKLLSDDGDTSQRYGVSSIPHTVIIDRNGVVREVLRGVRSDLEALVETIRTSK